MKEVLKIAVQATVSSGVEIMKVYGQGDFQVEDKEDNSPLTIADKKANDIINQFLLPTNIPVISEENRQLPYEERKDWKKCWIVDPLDGTKEFIKGNGEFTVNIALINNGKPEIGVIFAPVLGIIYFTDVSEKQAYKTQVEENESIETLMEKAVIIKPATNMKSPIKVVASRSHLNEETLQFLDNLKAKSSVEVVSIGSSLKFCLMAEGNADIYPRFAPTMEWDTAAGQAICEAVGVQVISQRTGEVMCYNKKELLNDFFVASYAH